MMRLPADRLRMIASVYVTKCSTREHGCYVTHSCRCERATSSSVLHSYRCSRIAQLRGSQWSFAVLQQMFNVWRSRTDHQKEAPSGHLRLAEESGRIGHQRLPSFQHSNSGYPLSNSQSPHSLPARAVARAWTVEIGPTYRERHANLPRKYYRFCLFRRASYCQTWIERCATKNLLLNVLTSLVHWFAHLDAGTQFWQRNHTRFISDCELTRCSEYIGNRTDLFKEDFLRGFADRLFMAEGERFSEKFFLRSAAFVPYLSANFWTEVSIPSLAWSNLDVVQQLGQVPNLPHGNFLCGKILQHHTFTPEVQAAMASYFAIVIGPRL